MVVAPARVADAGGKPLVKPPSWGFNGASPASPPMTDTPSLPPVAPQKPVVSSHHGITRSDPYAWLRAANWQEVFEAPETLPADIRAYLEAENAWYEANFAAPTTDLRETLFREMRGRIKEDESGIPTPDGPFAYNSRMEEGRQYPLIVRTVRATAGPSRCCSTAMPRRARTISASAGPSTTRAIGCSPGSPTGRARRPTPSPSAIWRPGRTARRSRRLADGVVWAPDSLSFYYVEHDESRRPFRVRRHWLGAPQADDPIIYEEADPGFFVGVDEMLGRSHIVIDVHDHQTSEVWLIDNQAGGAPQLMAPRMTGREYDVDERHGELFILTNADGAEDFKIAVAPVASPAAGNWRDLVPHRPGVLILDVIVISGHLLRLERVEGAAAHRRPRP